MYSFTRNGSGWVLKVDIRVVKYNPLRGSAYLALSKKLRESRFILNIRNDDEKCALYCILARLFPKNKEKCRNYKSSNPKDYEEHIDKIDTKYLSFPLLISDIEKLEKWNNLSITVFTPTSSDDIVPLRISDQQEGIPAERLIGLLYIANGNDTHYCLITN